jgi:glycosyltransferase involved in cell wall biosynthesis
MISTIIIPVSGNTSHVSNVIRILEEATKYQEKIQFLIIFDSKNTNVSRSNQDLLSKITLSNFEIVIGEYKSVGSVRNAGIERVKTDWFSFCDADDSVLLENYVEVLKVAIEGEFDLMIGSYNFNNQGVVYPQINKVELSQNCYEISKNPGLWRYIFRANKVSIIRFPAINMAEDQVYLSRVFGINPKVGISARPIYEYSVGVSGSLTSDLSQILKIKIAIEITSKLPKSRLDDLRIIQELMVISQWLTYLKYSSWLAKPGLFLGFSRSLVSRTTKDTKIRLRYLVYCLRGTK